LFCTFAYIFHKKSLISRNIIIKILIFCSKYQKEDFWGKNGQFVLPFWGNLKYIFFFFS
jgi:hypothetical protein